MLSIVIRRVPVVVNNSRRLFCTASEISPVNIFKDGKDPEMKSAEEYPEWMHTLHQPLKTFAQLERLDTERAMKEEDRFLKLINRQRIKRNNNLKN